MFILATIADTFKILDSIPIFIFLYYISMIFLLLIDIYIVLQISAIINIAVVNIILLTFS